MIEVEVCLESASEALARSVQAAEAGGATSLELCRDMGVGGLTPEPAQLELARRTAKRANLQVMVRPRAGDFRYNAAEIDEMLKNLELAAQAGADGVVFGVVDGFGLDVPAMTALVGAAKTRGLKTTCHRAFDAVKNRADALETLIDLGVDRVLTSGTPWEGGGTALEGVEGLRHTLRQAKGRLEVILGGGIGPENVRALLQALPLEAGSVSVHAFSGVHTGGVVDEAKVARLYRLANDQAA